MNGELNTTDPIRPENDIIDSEFKLLDLEEDFTALKLVLQDVLERLERLEAKPRARMLEERMNEGNNTTTT